MYKSKPVYLLSCVISHNFKDPAEIILLEGPQLYVIRRIDIHVIAILAEIFSVIRGYSAIFPSLADKMIFLESLSLRVLIGNASLGHRASRRASVGGLIWGLGPLPTVKASSLNFPQL